MPHRTHPLAREDNKPSAIMPLTGATAGAMAGALVGPAGIIAGGALGLALGIISAAEEQRKQQFRK